MGINSVSLNCSNYSAKCENRISMPKSNLLSSNCFDTVSFSGKNKPEFKYNDAWYLKNENIVEQDDFSTTVIDKSHKRSLIDIIKNKKYTKKIYDLPLRLREDLVKNNTDTVVQNKPEDILKETGLTNKEFIKEIDKINSLITLVAPRYDTFEDKTKQEFNIKLKDKVANVKRLAQGLSGSIYVIQVPNCKPLALKHYLNPMNINADEGAFPEIALAKKMNEDKVCDIPLLYCANPYNGWMLSDFVDENYKARANGVSFIDFMDNNKLYCHDMNSGMVTKGDDCAIFVDFGYIMPVESRGVNYERVISSDNAKRVNNDKYLNSTDVSDLTKIENVGMYGDENSAKKITNEIKTNHEMKFFNDTCKAVGMVLTNREIPEKLAERLQENYEKSGFVGDAVELVKSCNQ